ncbi:MAG: hypothetical protein ABIN55_01480 [Aeromicrobium sp.]
MADDKKTDQDDQKQDDKVDADKADDKADDADDQHTSDKADDTNAGEDLEAQLAAQRRINKQLERRTKKDLARIKELETTGDSKSTKSGDDAPDVEKIREEARAEARAEGQKERVTDKIEVRAAKAFADADDAVAILLRTHDVEDFLDGDKIDVEAIQEALDDLLENKPHLAAQGGKRFQGKADGGKRKADRPDQLTRDDLKRMSPSAIVKAKADGRLADLLAGSK